MNVNRLNLAHRSSYEVKAKENGQHHLWGNKLRSKEVSTALNVRSRHKTDPFLIQLFGEANEYKEGDESINITSITPHQRIAARKKLSKLPIGAIRSYYFVEDELSEFLEASIDKAIANSIAQWTFQELKEYLLKATEEEIKKIVPGLRSEVISGVSKLMSNKELITVAAKIYNNKNGEKLGAKGYFSSRIQPNSATDDPEEILFSVLEGLSYGCGDAILGINIVAGDHPNLIILEETLCDIVKTFELSEKTHWCVLAHIDDQLTVQQSRPDIMNTIFQSIGGTSAVNEVFNLDIPKLRHYFWTPKSPSPSSSSSSHNFSSSSPKAGSEHHHHQNGNNNDDNNNQHHENEHIRKGPNEADASLHTQSDLHLHTSSSSSSSSSSRYTSSSSSASSNINHYNLPKGGIQAVYFETGQGSAVTNRADEGVDMVTLECRAHGLARALVLQNHLIGRENEKPNWMILNTVAGFIGPEVFRSAAQLLRACLEDLFSGKMHGIIMGLDICSTYHMAIEPALLQSIQDEVMQAGPAFYMALPGNNDPMLSYLSTSFRDHPRLRQLSGTRVTDSMFSFFHSIGIMNEDGSMNLENAGNTARMYVLYRQRKGDQRSEKEIENEAKMIIKRLQDRGLDLGYGHDGNFNAPPFIKSRLETNYRFATKVIYENLSEEFIRSHQEDVLLVSIARNREDYVLHPIQGEQLSYPSIQHLLKYKKSVFRSQNKHLMITHSSSNNEKNNNDNNNNFNINNSGDDDDDDRNMRTAGSKGVLRRIPVQIVISEGLNHCAIEEMNHVDGENGYLRIFKEKIAEYPQFQLLHRDILVINGRVRVGYQVGRIMFSGSSHYEDGDDGDDDCGDGDGDEKMKAGIVLHVIGERPGNGKNTFSVYISFVSVENWKKGIDHNDAQLVSGISCSALLPANAVDDTIAILLNQLPKVIKLPSSSSIKK